MPFVPIPRTAQFNIKYLYNDEEAQNTLYFQNDGGWTPESLDEGCEILHDWWVTYCKPTQPTAVELTEVSARDLDTLNGAVGQFSPLIPQFGSQAVESMSNQVTLAVSFKTGFSGKSARGRNFWVGLTITQVDTNEVATNTTTQIEGAYTALIGQGSMIPDATWVVASRRSNNAWRVVGVVYPIREAIVVNRVVDTQRRRLPD